MKDYYLCMITSFILLGAYKIILIGIMLIAVVITPVALSKDISLMGGPLMVAGIYSEEEEASKS